MSSLATCAELAETIAVDETDVIEQQKILHGRYSGQEKSDAIRQIVRDHKEIAKRMKEQLAQGCLNAPV